MKKILSLALCLSVLFGCSSQKKTESNIKAENGDVVKLNYVGKLDGTAFQGGTAQGAILELGSGTYIDGFEEQVAGMSLGSSKTIEVTFPENYGSTDLAGKDVTFDIDLVSVYREETSSACQKGDIVKIDYVGKKDGELFSGGSENGRLLEPGSDTFELGYYTFVDGFKEQVIGMKARESKTIDVTIPQNYGVADLAGKAVTFDVAVNHIYRVVK